MTAKPEKTEWTKQEQTELRAWGFDPRNHPPLLTLERLLADRPHLLEYRVSSHDPVTRRVTS
jgi:hypothetical protein